MKDEFNPKHPYSKKAKKQITINLYNETIDYFKAQSNKLGIPYQILINLYLTECSNCNRELKISWD